MRIIKTEKLDDGRLYVAAEPEGVCSQAMEFLIKDGRVLQARVHGGCSGNSQGICHLVSGMLLDDIIERLEGIDCGGKGTSCPDQMSQVLKAVKAME